MKRSIITLLICAFFCLPASAKKEDNAIRPQKMWDKEFPGSITELEITPSGVIHAVARTTKKKQKDGKKKYWPQDRFLLTKDGQQFWRGEAGATTLVSDSPNPIMMKISLEGLTLHAISKSGAPLWKKNLERAPLSFLSHKDSDTLLLMTVPYGWMAGSGDSKAKLLALSLTSGSVKWTFRSPAMSRRPTWCDAAVNFSA